MDKYLDYFILSFPDHDIHEHNTTISGHFHIISVKSDLSKTGVRYRAAVI